MIFTRRSSLKKKIGLALVVVLLGLGITVGLSFLLTHFNAPLFAQCIMGAVIGSITGLIVWRKIILVKE